MRSAKRSPEPWFLAELRTADKAWPDDSSSPERGQIRAALRQDFKAICAYCQQSCEPVRRTQAQNGSETRPLPNEESIDHFRPRNKFPSLRFDWLNLIYACYRCNQRKGGSWPGCDEPQPDQSISDGNSGYKPVTEYVNPNAVEGQLPAGAFFDFNIDTGEMMPSEQLDRPEWYTARRTILDIDLNDQNLGENDRRHLWNQRIRQRDLLIEQLSQQKCFDAQVRMMLEFMAPDKPFSSFISAYVAGRFPLFVQLFQQP